MVSRRRFAVLVSIVLTAFLVAHAVRADARGLELVIADEQIELGKPLRMKLIARQLQASLEDFRARALEQDFAIASREYIANRQQDTQTLSLRLFARRTGNLTVPPLQLDGLTTNARHVLVTPARHPVDGTPIDVRFELVDRDLWQRQSIRLLATLESRDEYLVSQWEAPLLAHWTVESLQASRERIGPSGERFQHRLGWLVKPYQAGTQTLNLPPLVYISNGVPTHRFYPPLNEIRVKALPPYVAGNIPVGRLRIEQSRRVYFVSTGTLDTIELKLIGEGLVPDAVPPLSSQMRDRAGLTFYPVQVDRSQTLSARQVQAQVRYRIPFRVNRTGPGRRLPLELHYFDPEAGKLKKLRFEVALPVALHPILQFVLGLAVIFALGWAILHLARRLKQNLARLHMHRQAIRELRSARGAEAIYRALRISARAENWPTNITVQQWLSRWQDAHDSSDPLRQACVDVQRSLYRRHGPGEVGAETPRILRDHMQRAHPAMSLFTG